MQEDLASLSPTTTSALKTSSGLKISTTMAIDPTLGLTFGSDCSVNLRPEELCDCGYGSVSGSNLELPSQKPQSLKLPSQIQAELLPRSQAKSRAAFQTK